MAYGTRPTPGWTGYRPWATS